MNMAGYFLRVAATLLLASPTLAAGANPAVQIAREPLFSGRANVHPNLLLSLSVEFPTVGVAYRGDGGTYNRNTDYVGYFNPAKCYGYVGNERKPDDGIGADGSVNDYFKIVKDADQLHECGGDSFSGNFMNWASSSAIDMLRYALTGGDRVVDTADMTILQRAVLRDSAAGSFYAHGTYFPRREVVGGGNVSAPNQVTPFDAKTLYIVSCRNRILFSDSSSGLQGNKSADIAKASEYCTYSWNGKGKVPAQAVDKKLGEYLVRVRVCDDSEGPLRPALCQRYGAHYKPVGEIQRRAGTLRLAAMGYLLDDAAIRYGGVLRAPMKYVGPTAVQAPDFLAVPNSRREWDPDTGVFYQNPDDPDDRDSMSVNSGVINYLNKFGRSGQYKTYDPVSELYYEGIRYLQGKSPTAEATAGMTDAMKDGFPVITDWQEPVIASCQNNYILTIADVNTHWDRYVPGNDRTTYGDGQDAQDAARPVEAADGKTPELDVRKWTAKVGDMETDVNGEYGNPAKNSGLSDLQDRDTGSGGHGTYYMAGLAYWAHTHDIRLGWPTRVSTFAIDVDEGGNGQVDDNPRAIAPRDSQLYLAAKYGGFDDRNGDGNPYLTLAADGASAAAGSEWDQDGNGVPDNYFLAGQPQALIDAIHKAFARIGAASGSIAGVSVSTTKATVDGAYVYQPGFDSSTWSGSLKKFALVKNGATLALADTAAWDAGVLLSKGAGSSGGSTGPARPDRHLYTGRIADSGSWTTVEFNWNALSDQQRSLLDASPVDGEADGLGSERLDYLRGDRSHEESQPNGVFRSRTGILGDIVNSNPVYVGAPATSVDGAGYQAFYDAHKSRAPAVYIGANDGMLHAFDAASGKELFAYLPDLLFPQLNRLLQPDYTHRPYVDGMLAVSEARVHGAWRTILAGGFGGGAQGVFALDITDPSDFAGGDGALFEFSDADDPDMGNVTGTPVIVKLRTGTDLKDGAPQYGYYLMVGSGLDNYVDDGAGRFNANAAGALFLLSLDKQPAAKWKLGVNYFKFSTPSLQADAANGLGPASPVVGADGAVRYAYAGDLQGNLWRFDFTGAPPWPKALGDGTPLFSAKYGESVQPITVQPRVVYAPGGGYVVLFGTGKFLEDADAASGTFAPQSFYAIYDTTATGYAVAGRSSLMPRALTASADGGFQVSGEPFSYGTGEGGKQGWYVDFPGSGNSGERVVANPLVASGLLFFNSLIPGGDPCLPGGGRSYALNALTGLAADGADTGLLSQVGMPSAPVVFATGIEVGQRNAVGRRNVLRRYTVFNFGTGGAKGMAAPGITEQTNVPAGRFSWREILNWQELRDAANGS